MKFLLKYSRIQYKYINETAGATLHFAYIEVSILLELCVRLNYDIGRGSSRDAFLSD